MDFLRFVRANAAFLFAGVLLAFTSSFGQTYFISVFAGEIMATFALTDGQWGGIYTLGTTVSAIVMIQAGGLTDRFLARTLGPAMMGLLALSCLAMAVVTGPWMLVAVIFCLRFTGQGMLSHIAMVSMARWFVATRGRALSIASMGNAGGQAILPVTFVWLLAQIDWRWLWVIAAGLALLAVPAIAALLRLERTPATVATETEATGLDRRHWTRNEVVRQPLFWLMAPALMGPPAWGTALFFQQVHFAGVKGWELVDFVALMPIFIASSVTATFASGWAIDRFGTGPMAMVYMLPFAASFAIFAVTDTIAGAAVAFVVMGVGTGMQATLPGAFWAEWFGTRHVGSIKAAGAAIMVFGTAIGPGISGGLIDLGIDFPDQMWGIAVYFLIAGATAAVGIRAARPRLARAS